MKFDFSPHLFSFSFPRSCFWHFFFGSHPSIFGAMKKEEKSTKLKKKNIFTCNKTWSGCWPTISSTRVQLTTVLWTDRNKLRRFRRNPHLSFCPSPIIFFPQKKSTAMKNRGQFGSSFWGWWFDPFFFFLTFSGHKRDKEREREKLILHRQSFPESFFSSLQTAKKKFLLSPLVVVTWETWPLRGKRA